MNKQQLVKVFIVDDNTEAVKVLKNMLESSYSVTVVGTAGDAETAADAIINTEPDIIFLDIELPTMSGLEFCTLIRNDIKPLFVDDILFGKLKNGGKILLTADDGAFAVKCGKQ